MLRARASLGEDEILRFILDEIDSVPHLEALLLLWNSRPRVWSIDDVADWLFFKTEVVRGIVQDLARRRLIVAEAGSADRFRGQPKSDEGDRLIEAVATAYRRELVRVSTFIHSNPPSAVREFARAFRFTKERE